MTEQLKQENPPIGGAVRNATTHIKATVEKLLSLEGSPHHTNPAKAAKID